MCKRILFILAIAMLAFATANANSVVYTVDLEIPTGTPSITADLYKVDGWDSAQRNNPWLGELQTQPVMAFGQLTYLDDQGRSANQWYGRYYFFVALYTTSFGRQYIITQDGTYLAGGGQQLPEGCFGYVPGYSRDDEWSPGHPQGEQPTGSRVGNPMRVVNSGGYIYLSEPEASNRIIRTFYSLPRPDENGGIPWGGYELIPLSQAPGAYSGSVMVTITAR